MTPRQRAELRRGRSTLLACAVGVGVGLSPLPTFSLGLFAVALEGEFGWSRGAILLQPAIGVVMILLLGPLIGRLADRRGARPVALASTLGLGLGIAALGLVQAPVWTYWLASAAMAAAGIGTLPIVYAKVVNQWFDEARGLALGFALCATGIAGLVIPSYVQWLIGAFGWRWAYAGLALLPLAIGLPVLLLLLRHDAPPPLDGDEPEAAVEGVTVRHGLASPRFWLMALAAMAAGAAINGMLANLVPLMVDRGIAPTRAAQLFSMFGVAVVVGRIGGGWCLDRFWAPAVAAAVFMLPAAAALLFTLDGLGAALTIIAVACVGLAGGAEFDIIAYLTSRYFGRRNFATLYAVQYAMFAIGSGFAPAIFGRLRDLNGDYALALRLAAVLMVAAAVALLCVGRYPTRAELQEQGV